MAEYSKENLYYVNLKNDFFNEHYIKILKGMPNGEKYLVLYLQLICESISHGGFLRYSKDIPYTPEMIASVTNTDIDVVRVGIEALKSLGLMQVTEGGSLYLPKVKEMTRITTKGAEKKQKQLARRNEGGTGVENLPPDIRDKSIEYKDHRDTPSEEVVSSDLIDNNKTKNKKMEEAKLPYFEEHEMTTPVKILLDNGFIPPAKDLDAMCRIVASFEREYSVLTTIYAVKEFLISGATYGRDTEGNDVDNPLGYFRNALQNNIGIAVKKQTEAGIRRKENEND